MKRSVVYYVPIDRDNRSSKVGGAVIILWTG